MRKKALDRLLAPNLWIGVFCILAVVGIVCLILGYRNAGIWLLAPLLVAGVIVVFVLIPILIRANRKQRNRANGHEPENRV